MPAEKGLKMIELFIIMIGLAAAFLALYGAGKGRARAEAAEKQSRTDRRAHEIQNDVMFDPALRERVRRHFDNP